MTRHIRLAAVLGASLLTVGGAEAQVGSYLDRLVSGSATITPLRSIDTSVRASKRYAVVIGNGNYQAIPRLDNAVADASVVAEFLRGQDYIVQHRTNLTKRGFEDALRRILFDVDKETEVVIFFAGHGFQIGSENYLVPVDADLDSVYDIPFEAVSLGSLVSIVGARARLQVVILDSCRDNPFAGKAAMTEMGVSLRETKTGFSSLAAPLNSMLIYSTSPGALAFDGEGDNSPFTAALVQEASARPDDEIKDVFEGVRRAVYQATNGQQVPWDSSTLIEPASFGIGAALSRPLAVNSTGTGQTRGLARIAATEEAPLILAASEDVSAVIDADFVPEVSIGAALAEALDLAPETPVTVTAAPDAGRLVLTGDDGVARSVVNRPLLAADLRDLVLINESVQTPALSLDDGILHDRLRLLVNGDDREVALRLSPQACDFHAGDHLDPDGMGLTRYPNELEPEAALAACEAAVAENPDTGRFHYQLGRARLALKDMAGAETAFETARDLGHARAWYALGNIAFEKAKAEGRVIDGKSPEDVLAFHARGTDAGDPYAFYALGRQLMRFGATEAIEVEGYDLVMRALEVGHTFAMNDLAFFYLNENSEYFDGERGLRYLRESAAREDIYGYNSLGIAYLRGQAGLDVDEARAYELFTRAAADGHPTAPFNIGRMYLEGRAPGGANANEAVAWFETGLSRGHARSAAWAADVILVDQPGNYDVFDAPALASKGAVLTGNPFVHEAESILAGMPAGLVDGGAQRLINELADAGLTVDGAFGPSSQTAYEAVLADFGGLEPETDSHARIRQLARLTWLRNPFRVDLY
ncbi:hypothetical protein GQ651_17910 [Alphaproteobacteria bacterium GH1-50]|uniref:Caspase family p20 domain-containing protein n=1 Tax=Kangsaoukella pontilimi TaxID=2691042 RepID=A0A7C9IUE2_9RHOB|nr:caspase family protein [Kangsaoukella pontilimi]MXQ09725.1 hypothetical protein [Kangsaoukella pontilimi]